MYIDTGVVQGYKGAVVVQGYTGVGVIGIVKEYTRTGEQGYRSTTGVQELYRVQE